MVAGTPRLAGIESRHHGREHARNGRQDRDRDTLLHHVPGMAGAPARAGRPRPLVNRKQPALVNDMLFRDDECRIRTDHAPANFTTLKHIAHNLIRRAPGKDSLRLKRKVAAWDDEFLASLIAA